MRHLNFPKTQPTYNPQEWTGVDPRYSHRLEVPTTAPIEARANQAQALPGQPAGASAAGA